MAGGARNQLRRRSSQRSLRRHRDEHSQPRTRLASLSLLRLSDGDLRGPSLDPGERTATKDNPEIYADLSGIAKGWAVDLIALRLREQGYDRFLVEVGGEVRSAGERAEGGAWRLAIESPQPGSRKVQRIVELSGEAMATSGDYRNFYERHGRRYSHTIDPRTGRPVSHSLASATVIHPRCAVADAWATAMMVLGPEEGLRLAEQEGLAVLLLVYDADGVSELESSAFGRFAGQER